MRFLAPTCLETSRLDCSCKQNSRINPQYQTLHSSVHRLTLSHVPNAVHLSPPRCCACSPRHSAPCRPHPDARSLGLEHDQVLQRQCQSRRCRRPRPPPRGELRGIHRQVRNPADLYLAGARVRAQWPSDHVTPRALLARRGSGGATRAAVQRLAWSIADSNAVKQIREGIRWRPGRL